MVDLRVDELRRKNDRADTVFFIFRPHRWILEPTPIVRRRFGSTMKGIGGKQLRHSVAQYPVTQGVHPRRRVDGFKMESLISHNGLLTSKWVSLSINTSERSAHHPQRLHALAHQVVLTCAYVFSCAYP